MIYLTELQYFYISKNTRKCISYI